MSTEGLPEAPRETLERWIADGETWIGVFENHDLGHPEIGRRIAFPFSTKDGSFEAAEVNKTRAPDSRHIGLGWRYILIAKCTTADEAFMSVFTGERSNDAQN